MLLTTSENIADLATALSKAQGAFPAIDKGKTARVKGENKKSGEAVEFTYAYADLADILQAVRKPLSENGLSIIQPVVDTPEQVILVTRLLHASGQWIESTYPVDMYEKPQETGSALTYARRYAITALLGIAAEEDDDGAAAQGGTRSSRQPAKARPACPKCGHNRAVIEGKEEFGGGWLCFKKKEGCGHNWHDAERPAATSGAPAATSAPAPSAPAGETCSSCGSADTGKAKDGMHFCRACGVGWKPKA